MPSEAQDTTLYTRNNGKFSRRRTLHYTHMVMGSFSALRGTGHLYNVIYALRGTGRYITHTWSWAVSMPSEVQDTNIIHNVVTRSFYALRGTGHYIIYT